MSPGGAALFAAAVVLGDQTGSRVHVNGDQLAPHCSCADVTDHWAAPDMEGR